MDKIKTTTIIAIAILAITVASLGVTIYLNKDKFKGSDKPKLDENGNPIK
jgi:hypothetical protein